MPNDPFDLPSAGTRLTEFEGQLLLIKPIEVREGILTTVGVKDAVSSDVTPLDGPQAGHTEHGVLIFQQVIKAQLRSKIGTDRYLLGRLVKGTVAKVGQKPPWLLAEPTEADKQTARNHLNKLAATSSPPF